MLMVILNVSVLIQTKFVKFTAVFINGNVVEYPIELGNFHYIKVDHVIQVLVPLRYLVMLIKPINMPSIIHLMLRVLNVVAALDQIYTCSGMVKYL